MKKAFDLAQEPAQLRRSLWPHRLTPDRAVCSLRRLVEAGARLPSTFILPETTALADAKNTGGWDTHGFDNNPACIPLLKESPSAALGSNAADVDRRPGNARLAGQHAGGLGRRVWPSAKNQQAGGPRSLAAMLHGSCSPAAAPSRRRPFTVHSDKIGALSRRRTPCVWTWISAATTCITLLGIGFRTPEVM